MSELLLHRMTYIARLALWTVCHLSLERARWVLAFEGTTWNKNMTEKTETTAKDQAYGR